jgi:MoxR-like ATPase
VLASRDYVVPDDVRTEARVVMPHRIRTDTAEQTGAGLVQEALDTVPIEE